MSNPLEAEVANRPNLLLIVDDSPTVRKIARRILSTLPLELDDAENGQIALEKCSTRVPNLILLDWNMPVMNGIDFLRSLRRTEGGQLPKVIMCTTETDVDHVKEAFDAGANEYIMKPFDRESLHAKISAVIAAEALCA